MAAQWPVVKAWLARTIGGLGGLQDVQIFSGPIVTGDFPDRYVTVGYVTDDNAGTYQRAPEYDGTIWRETGELRSQIVAKGGDSDPTAHEPDAFAIADAIDAHIHRVQTTSRTLDGTLSLDSSVETTVEVHSIASEYGSATALVHVLRYTTTNTN